MTFFRDLGERVRHWRSGLGWQTVDELWANSDPYEASYFEDEEGMEGVEYALDEPDYLEDQDDELNDVDDDVDDWDDDGW